MARNLRAVADWKEEHVDSLPVAPHRMLYNKIDDYEFINEYRPFVKASPYQPGEVIWVEHYKNGGNVAVKAKVYAVYAERDYYGDLRHVYKVQLATAKNIFSKSWIKTYPGYIQRGYFRAGLVPECPADFLK